MTEEHLQFLLKAEASAARAGHVFPKAAACEAALESAWGKSALATDDFNLLGMKQHAHAVHGTVNLPTKEFINGDWVRTVNPWVKYPDWVSCFADRMATLNRLAPAYPSYKRALDAKDAETFVREVSKTWSTDPAWMCTCGEEFASEQPALAHRGTYNSATHMISVIPGLGRALKVLAIYHEYLTI